MALSRCKVFDALEQICVAVGANFCITKFTRLACFNFAAQLLRHGLHAIANAQNRNTQLKNGVGRTIVNLVHTGM